MFDLSILIPGKDEPYLRKTIEDLLTKIEGNTEILVGLDGWTQGFDIWDGRRLQFAVRQPGIGQRAMTNELARLSTAKYLLKCDAHVLFSKGFDVELMKAMDDRTIMAPYMLRLDAENWKPIPKPVTSMYYFDPEFVMQYGANNDEIISDTMCVQGSAWMITRENYWKWNVCDESLGSWGGQAIELGIRAYLNGGRCVTNKNCFYAHLFRTLPEQFPYDRGNDPGLFAKEELKKRYKNKSIAGLVEKFNHPAGWTKELVAQLA